MTQRTHRIETVSGPNSTWQDYPCEWTSYSGYQYFHLKTDLSYFLVGTIASLAALATRIFIQLRWNLDLRPCRRIAFYRAGKPHRESSHSENESDARRLLKLREGQIIENPFPGLRVEKIRFEELAQDFLNDYRVNGKRSKGRAEKSLKHIKAFFERMGAVEITPGRKEAYILQRQEEEEENATINRKLAALKRMFHLAGRKTTPKITSIPYIPHRAENTA